MSLTPNPYFSDIRVRKYSVMSPGALIATLRPRKSFALRIVPSSHSALRTSGWVDITGPWALRAAMTRRSNPLLAALKKPAVAAPMLRSSWPVASGPMVSSALRISLASTVMPSWAK